MNEKTMKIFHWTALGIMALILLLQFVPFWSTPEGGVSINSYVWFPHQNEALTEQFRTVFGADFYLNDAFVVGPVVQTVLCILALCLFKKRDIFTASLQLFAGLAGVLSLALQPALRMGSVWFLLLLASTLLMIAAIPLLTEAIRRKLA